MSEFQSDNATKKLVRGKIASTTSVFEIGYGTIIQTVDELIYPPEGEEFLAPGFIDVQVNGFAGVDYNDPAASHQAICQSIRRMFVTGVTRLFPTVITGSRECMIGALRNLASAKEEFSRRDMPEAQAIEGFHMEGPHISPEDGPRGAHPVEHVRPPDIDEFKEWQEVANGLVRIVTVSPEWEETPSYITELVRSGVVASIGHTKATSEQIAAAVDAGATMS